MSVLHAARPCLLLAFIAFPSWSTAQSQIENLAIPANAILESEGDTGPRTIDVLPTNAAKHGISIVTYRFPINLHARFDRIKSYNRRHVVKEGQIFCGWKVVERTKRKAAWNVGMLDPKGFLFSGEARGGPLHNRYSGRLEVTVFYRGVSFPRADPSVTTRPPLNCNTDGFRTGWGGSSNTPAEPIGMSCVGDTMICTTVSRDAFGKRTEKSTSCGKCIARRF